MMMMLLLMMMMTVMVMMMMMTWWWWWWWYGDDGDDDDDDGDDGDDDDDDGDGDDDDDDGDEDEDNDDDNNNKTETKRMLRPHLVVLQRIDGHLLGPLISLGVHAWAVQHLHVRVSGRLADGRRVDFDETRAVEEHLRSQACNGHQLGAVLQSAARLPECLREPFT